jgi:hypothetical protein
MVLARIEFCHFSLLYLLQHYFILYIAPQIYFARVEITSILKRLYLNRTRDKLM